MNDSMKELLELKIDEVHALRREIGRLKKTLLKYEEILQLNRKPLQLGGK